MRAQRVKLARPLDFTAVTDHAEYLGSSSICTREGSSAYDSELCRSYRGTLSPDLGMETVARVVGGVLQRLNGPELCGPDGARCRAATAEPWRLTREAAARANDPCRFTAFVGYEYSMSPEQSKVHRNVVFRSEIVPELPISWVDEPDVVGLWRRLREQCIEAGSGCDALTIPHNPNLANGRMFVLDYAGAQGRAEQAALAEQRARIEPLVEIFQKKGASECRNGMWQVGGAADEQCAFESYREFRQPAPEDCRDGIGAGAMRGLGCSSRMDFARYALAAGLRERARIGANPLKFGFIGSTDAHDGTSGDVDEWANDGIERPLSALDFGRSNPGGLAAVWAEENTREALFDALERRETYATSGPRLAVRFFGGWGYAPELCTDPKFAAKGYAGGVPMGGDLPEREGTAAPSFAVSALRDPGTPEQPGGLLQRIQIVKVWVSDDGWLQQAVFDVAGGENGASVDPQTCAARGPGARRLCAVWRDPQFDAARDALYYARVLENPSCRYTALICRNLPPERRPALCADPAVPRSIQERAWTAPIWYEAPQASEAQVRIR
jgi:hypothetical protein